MVCTRPVMTTTFNLMTLHLFKQVVIVHVPGGDERGLRGRSDGDREQDGVRPRRADTQHVHHTAAQRTLPRVS